MRLRNFIIVDIHKRGDKSITLLMETLSDGSKCFSVKLSNNDGNEIIIDCASEKSAVEVWGDSIDILKKADWII